MSTGIIIALSIVIVLLLLASCTGVMFYWYKTRSSRAVANKDEIKAKSTMTKHVLKNIPISSFLSGDVITSRSEFEMLNEQECLRTNLTSSQGGLNKNKPLNANQDILPFDHNRVKLRHAANRGDYVNASWISQVSKEKEYDCLMMHSFLPLDKIGMIVCDSPNESSVGRYDQMIYQNDVDLILHIPSNDNYRKSTNMKLQRQTPDELSNVSRKLLKTVFVENYLVKEDWDVSTERGKTNKFVYFELSGFYVNNKQAIDQVLRTITTIRNELKCSREHAMMVIHDDHSGVSEAAIFAVLFDLLEQLDDALLHTNRQCDKNQNLDVFNAVNDLRKKRMKMVQSFEEYRFVHDVLMYYAKHKASYDELLRSLRSTGIKKEGYLDYETYFPSAPREELPDSYLIDELRQTKLNETDDDVYFINVGKAKMEDKISKEYYLYD